MGRRKFAALAQEGSHVMVGDDDSDDDSEDNINLLETDAEHQQLLGIRALGSV